MNLLSAVKWTQLEHAKRGRKRIIETVLPHWRLTMILGVDAGESSTAAESFSVRRETSRECLRFQTGNNKEKRFLL